LGLRAFTRSPIELVEARVAVGHKRANLEHGGQGHCGTVVRLGRRHVGAAMMRGDLAQEAEGLRLGIDTSDGKFVQKFLLNFLRPLA
jgi:hypothetical protein